MKALGGAGITCLIPGCDEPSAIAEGRIDVTAAPARLREAAPPPQGPWLGSVTESKLLESIADIRGFGVPVGSRIGLGHLELAAYGSFWRATLRFKDFDSGQYFAMWQLLYDSDPVSNNLLLDEIIAYEAVLPGYSGITFSVAFDKARIKFEGGAKYAVEFERYEDCGLKADVLISNATMDDFCHSPKPVRIVEVSLPEHDLATATSQFYLPNSEIPQGRPEYSSFPLSAKNTYANQIAFDVGPGSHSVNGLVTMPYQIIRGKGANRTTLYNSKPLSRVLEATQSVHVSDVTLHQSVDEYIVHIDNYGARSKPATIGPPGQHWFIRQHWERINFVAEGAQRVSMVGMGISGGQQLHVTDCHMWRRDRSATGPAFLIHDTPNTVTPAHIHMKRVRNDTGAAGLALLGSHAMNGIRHRVIVEDCALGLITGQVLLSDNDPMMPARARDRWPYEIVITGQEHAFQFDDPKMRVLSVPQSTSLGGTAITALFGDGYRRDDGLGDQLILDGSIRSLGKRLGDRRAQPWLLALGIPVLGYREVSLDRNYADWSEADILHWINAKLGSPIISVQLIKPRVSLACAARTDTPPLFPCKQRVR